MTQQSNPTVRYTNTEVFEFEKVSPALEAQRILLAKYPIFFRAVKYPKQYPCNLSHWGIQCGPGWYPIIDSAIQTIEIELCSLLIGINSFDILAEIESRMQNNESETKSGLSWQGSVDVLIPFCKQVSINDIGELNMFSSGGYSCNAQSWARIRDAIKIAIKKTYKTCERCGAYNAKPNDNWGRIYCDQCSSLSPMKMQSAKS